MLNLPNDKVAITPMFDADKIGSIWIPDMAKERCDQGIVKYKGPKCVIPSITIGSHVIFSGYSGTLLELEGEGLLIILPEKFITAVIEEPICEVPGLYFKGKNGSYFQANYEQAMTLMAKALQETDVYRGIDIKVTRPSVEDYDEL